MLWHRISTSSKIQNKWNQETKHMYTWNDCVNYKFFTTYTRVNSQHGFALFFGVHLVWTFRLSMWKLASNYCKPAWIVATHLLSWNNSFDWFEIIKVGMIYFINFSMIKPFRRFKLGWNFQQWIIIKFLDLEIETNNK